MEIEQINYGDELILVVDDDEGTGENLEELLKYRGFNAHHVVSGSDALDELKKERSYTILLSDIVMPEIDGLELMRRAKNEYPYLCIVAMTGYTEKHQYIDVLNAGATDFINKPFGPDELEVKIRRGIIERERKERYRSLIANVPVSLYRYTPDPHGRFLMANPALAKMFGYDSAEELLRVNASDLYADPRDLEAFSNKLLFRGRVESEELRLKKKDGTSIWGAVTVSVIKNTSGQIRYFDGMIEDISARKQAEEKLRDSEEKLRTIFENSNDIIVWVDESGKIINVNSKIEDMVGYKKAEVIGKDFTEFPIFSPETMQNVIREVGLAFKSGNTKLLELEMNRKDGGSVPVEVSAKMIQGADGRLSILAAVRDIAVRKQAEEGKTRLESQLQQARKMEAIGTLAGGVAHDLNNILSGIVGYPDLLLMQLPEDSPLRKPIVTMKETGKKAATIVRDMLTLARIGVADFEVISLNAVISEYLGSPEYKKLKSYYPGVEVECGLETDLMNILGSPAHLSKTIMNLVSNAAEAITEKGKITISSENRYIDRPISGYENVEEGDYIVFTVSDTGAGISPEDIKRVFEPFYTKKKMGRSGTGLGMAVVWGTIKDHNGYIDVQSTVEKGTTFTLYFPMTRQELSKDQVGLPIEDYMGRGESILVVDDVKDQREIASTMLSELGFSVTVVSSGEEAVEYLQTNSVDLLLLDMIMDPGMDGLDAYKKIVEIHPDQKAIIASGFSETARLKKAQKLGAGQYLRKPYILEKIGMVVRKELDKE